LEERLVIIEIKNVWYSHARAVPDEGCKNNTARKLAIFLRAPALPQGAVFAIVPAKQLRLRAVACKQAEDLRAYSIGSSMKFFVLLTTLALSTNVFAAPKEVIDAVLDVSNIKNVTSVEQTQQDRCFGCYTFLVKGQGPFGDAYQKISTEQTGPSTYKTQIIEQSK